MVLRCPGAEDKIQVGSGMGTNLQLKFKFDAPGACTCLHSTAACNAVRIDARIPSAGEALSCVQDSSISSIASVISCGLVHRSHADPNS